ncbi:DUF6198 family protein, partial [Alistipes sp.]|uniref:DUF6198 family protein n=1 Tax=Alistipes sp. TaxID=1872444 RepID=UPI003A84901F
MRTENRLLLRRYLLFVVALFINAFGIALITKALLGTSPITSVTYVLSMFTPLTMGQWTIVLNLLFMLGELPFMTRQDLKNDRRIFLLQIPVTLFFGTFIDCSMSALSWLEPQAYAAKIVSLLLGCFVLAVGIAFEVKVNVAMAAGEYFVRAISRRLHREFGYVKLGFDVTLVILACVLSLVFLSGIYGVREGTVTAALIVGPIVHFISPFYRILDRWIGDGTAAPAATAARTADASSRHVVITIAREYGSGGHLLGEKLASMLHIPLYDNQFIGLAARRSGMDEAYILHNEQSIPSFWLKCIFAQTNGARMDHSLSPEDVLFVAESRIVQELASREACVIVGRCADFVLRDDPRAVRIFCCTDPESARRRCIAEYGIAPDAADAEVRRVNRNRKTHYEYYTGERWGDPHRFDLTVNTGRVSVEDAARTVAGLYRERLAALPAYPAHPVPGA